MQWSLIFIIYLRRICARWAYILPRGFILFIANANLSCFHLYLKVRSTLYNDNYQSVQIKTCREKGQIFGRTCLSNMWESSVQLDFLKKSFSIYFKMIQFVILNSYFFIVRFMTKECIFEYSLGPAVLFRRYVSFCEVLPYGYFV